MLAFQREQTSNTFNAEKANESRIGTLLVRLEQDIELEMVLFLASRSHFFTIGRMPRTYHPRLAQDAFCNIGPGAAGWIVFEPGRCRLAADRETLCGYDFDLKMIGHVSPVGDRKHPQANLCVRWQQQRIEAASAQKVANNDATAATWCKHFNRVDTTFGEQC